MVQIEINLVVTTVEEDGKQKLGNAKGRLKRTHRIGIKIPLIALLMFLRFTWVLVKYLIQ